MIHGPGRLRQKSFVVKAGEYDVPIYTSSPGDSAIGMNLSIPYLFGRDIQLNPLLDVLETTAIVRDANLNGVVEIGGGSPKNFYLQTQPTLHQMLLDKSKGGHDFCLQLTTNAVAKCSMSLEYTSCIFCMISYSYFIITTLFCTATRLCCLGLTAADSLLH